MLEREEEMEIVFRGTVSNIQEHFEPSPSLSLTLTCGLFNPENTEEERQTKTACAGGVDCEEEAKPVNFMEKKTS